MERDFKTNAAHWNLIIDFVKMYPNLIKGKFLNPSGDSANLKNKWGELTTQLNGLGYGQRTVEKWQLAIGRWKSKIKAKASVLNRERNRTGGGPMKTSPLTEIEEKLMAILGWRSVTGDSTPQLGIVSRKPVTALLPETSTGTRNSETITNTQAKPPPLKLFKLGCNEKESSNTRQQKNSTEEIKAAKEVTKRKIPLRTDKSRKYVTLNTMHKEHTVIPNNINKSMEVIALSVQKLSTNFEKYINYLESQDNKKQKSF